MGPAPITDDAPPSEHPSPGSAAQWLLTGAACVGVASLLLVALGSLVGARPLVVAGGSMGDALPLGSLALAVEVPAHDVDRGDVVSVVRADGTRVTHRVVGIGPAGPEAPDDASVELVLQGDANPGPDATVDRVASVDRVIWSVPGLGTALAWASSPLAAYLFGVLSGALLWWTFSPASSRRVGAVVWLARDDEFDTHRDPGHATVQEVGR